MASETRSGPEDLHRWQVENDKSSIAVTVKDVSLMDNILPGVFHLQKGFNKFKGVPFFEGGETDRDIFNFTFNEGKSTSGNTAYLVPDQMDIPPLAYQCIFSDRTSELTYGNSVEFMLASEKSSAFDEEVSASFEGTVDQSV